MKRRSFLVGMLAVPFAGTAYAQSRMRRVAVVTLSSLSRQPLASLFEGLRELGYENGRNVELLLPEPKTQYRQLPAMAAAAVERGAEVIVAYGATAIAATKRTTRTVPIVMIVGADPVALGFITNLARPEGNITGLATSTQVLIAKRMELLRESVPGLRRLAVLWNSDSAGQKSSLDILVAAATRAGVTVDAIDLRGRNGVSGVSDLLAKDRPDALTPLSSTTLRALGPEVIKLAAAHKLPAIYADPELVREGALMAYSADTKAQVRRAAYYVDRLLKGAKPGDLPVEQPTKFELAVNLKTARALGITIPQSVLLRADELIQ
jgi:putative ABC transport system substrate-binding protein